ncbi:MAG: hypothetical protein VW397_08870 [Candidatus Margulisiibacteriota bacterium]
MKIQNVGNGSLNSSSQKQFFLDLSQLSPRSREGTPSPAQKKSKTVRFFSPRASNTLNKAYDLKRIKSDSAILIKQRDPLSTIRSQALPFTIFIDNEKLVPNEDHCKGISKLLYDLANHLSIDDMNQITSKKWTALVEFAFADVDGLTQSDLPLQLITNAKDTWKAFLDIISALNKETTPEINATLTQLILNMKTEFIEFEQSYQQFKEVTLQALTKLYLNLEKEAKSHINHPDPLNELIIDGIRLFQVQVKQQIADFDELAIDNLNRKLIELNNQWDSIKWIYITQLERYRDLWITYLETKRFIFPELNQETFNFDMLEGLNKDHPETNKRLHQIVNELIFDTLPNSIAEPLKVQFESLSSNEDSEYQGYAILVDRIFDALVRYIKTNAPAMDINENLKTLNQQLESSDTEDQIVAKLTFILFNCEVLSQYQFKEWISYKPNELCEMAIKLEQSFFKSHLLEDTQKSIENFMDYDENNRCFFPSFGRHFLVDEILGALSNQSPLLKKSLPEILRWDYSRILNLKQRFEYSISKCVFIHSTQYFLQSIQKRLPNTWQSQLLELSTISDQINWASNQAQLTDQQSDHYKRTILANIQPDSAVFQLILKRIKPQLSAYIINPNTRFKNQDIFSQEIKTIGSIVNYLGQVHQPLFDTFHRDYIQRKLMQYLQPKPLTLIANSPLKEFENEISKIKIDLKKIGQAMSSMMVVRQQFNAKFDYFGSDQKINDVFNSIPDRIQQLFSSHLSIRNRQETTAQEFRQDLNQICIQFYNDLNSKHWDIMKEHLLSFLSLPSLPSINSCHPILLNIWETLEPMYHCIHLLSDAEQSLVLNQFKENDIFPGTTDSFIKMNTEIERLFKNDQSMPEINFNHRQFSIPFRLCWGEIMANIIQIMHPDQGNLTTHFDVDTQTKSLLKTHICHLINKLLNYTKVHDPYFVLSINMRSGFEI